MNKSKLKAYAPQARRDFIQMIRQRADLLGLTKKEIAPAVADGSISTIEGRPYPKSFAASHTKLAAKISVEGVEPLIERVAYSWFNRIAALRFMEMNGFLSHGFRVLSNADTGKNEPEILTHAAEVELPGLDKEKVLRLKLDGNREAELYRLLFIAQCNELNRAMPFLFERVNDETEILLPDNLLQSDSVIRRMVSAIDEADWEQVEIIGWLYQFYISEKKDEVIGKTVKSEDIPAATQLFTPNWIVKYMTQNSLGRLWLEANPHSSLTSQMEFYVKGVRDEGLGISEEEGEKYDGSEFQGFDRVAEGDGYGSDGLSIDETVSEGGTLRFDQSGAAGGGFSSIEHRGRTRTDINGGVSQFSLDSERIAGRGADSNDDRSTSELHNDSTTKSDSFPANRNPQNAQFSDKETNPQPLIPNPFPLNPEDLKILDPACGSGHILVEAYELLKAIYTERGYSSRDIPLLILENNLFGLDIDERAAQMASFALLMKARRDDRRIFEKIRDKGQGIRDKGLEGNKLIPNPLSLIPHVLTVPDSSQLAYEARGIAEMFFSRDSSSANAAVPIRESNFLFGEMETQPSLTLGGSDYPLTPNPQPLNEVSETNITDLLELFEQGKTLGSLIRIPHGFGAVVDKLEKAAAAKLLSGNFYEQVAARELEPFVRAGRMLANKYDCVIANPPYMGGKGMNGELKAFAAKNFPDSKSDLFAMFIERAMEHIKPSGSAAFVTPFVWMFISSYEKFRKNLIEETPLSSLIQLEYNAFEPACVPVCTFTMKKNGNSKLKGEFIKLSDFKGHQNQAPKTLEAINNPNCGWRFSALNTDFEKIPGSPIAYWVSNKSLENFQTKRGLLEFADLRSGISTGDNETFYRFWFEVELAKTNFKPFNDYNQGKWFPIIMGGNFRRWYGNKDSVINLQNDGFEIRNSGNNFRLRTKSFYTKRGITWSRISSSELAFRIKTEEVNFGENSPCFFLDKGENELLGLLNSKVAGFFLGLLTPTLSNQVADVGKIPVVSFEEIKINKIVEEAVAIARADWNSFETSWDFKRLPLLGVRGGGLGAREEGEEVISNPLTLTPNPFSSSVEECWQSWKNLCDERISRMQELETENNRLFIEAYGLEDELSPEVPLAQITLARADAEKDTRRLLSYFVGCLMGRYSLDRDGLIYADSAGKGFDALRYQTFPADDDGIVPVTDLEWFPQEAANRFVHFVHCAFEEGAGDQGIGIREGEEQTPNPYSLTPSSTPNLQWIAEQLGAKSNETPVETIRRYFSTAFFKDHLQTYKKRPIYWLFSSGKQKAFEALVYLHRYSENTLPRMRHEYVLPLMSKLTAQIETLDSLIEGAETTSERAKLTKQLETFKKKQTELAGFDEKLRHAADLKITLDLDDGVKVNYGKFGDLLAEVKQVAVTKE